MVSIREQILNGTYESPTQKKKNVFVPIKNVPKKGDFNKLPKKKDYFDKTKDFLEGVLKVGNKAAKFVGEIPKKVANVITNPKETLTGMGAGFKDTVEDINTSFDEKVGVGLKALFDPNKNYEEKLKEYRKNKENDLQNQINYFGRGDNELNILNAKITDTKTYQKAQLGELTEKEQEAYGLGQSIGRIGTAMAGTALTGNPLVGKLIFGTSTQQSYQKQALNEGKTELQSILYSIPMTVAETYLEGKLGVGFKFKSNALIKSALEEGLEEFSMPYIDSIVRKIGFNEDIDLKSTTEEAIKSAIDGAAMGIIMQGVSNAVPNAVKVYDKVKNNQKVTSQEIKQAVKDSQKMIGEDILGNTLNEVANQTNTHLNNLNNESISNQNTTNRINIPNISEQASDGRLNRNIDTSKTSIQERINNLENKKKNIDTEIGKIIKKYRKNPIENLLIYNKLSEESANIRTEIDNLKDSVINLPINNKLITVYGKENYDDKIKGYMELNKNNIVYDIDKDPTKKRITAPGLQLPNASNSSIDNISQSDNTVNNYNMQEIKNNTNTVYKNLPKDPTKESSYDMLPIIQKEKQQLLEEQKIRKTTLLEDLHRDKKTLKQEKDQLIQQFVNKGHYIDQLAKQTGNKELTFKYDKMLSAIAEGQYVVGEAQTNNKGEIIGKSINEIWKPVEDAKLTKEFSEYLLHKHNIDRANQGKNIFGLEITSDMSSQMASNYERLYPDFIEYSKDINLFNKNQLQNMVEADLTSEQMQEYLNATYENYVRVGRSVESQKLENKIKKAGVKNPLQKAEFSNEDILPLKDAMAAQAIAVKQAIRRNEFGLELAKEIRGEIAENYDLENLVSKDKDGAKFTIFEKGKPINLKISDELYESLKNSSKYDWENIIPFRAIRQASKVQRSLLTVDNPLFIVTNFFKDFQDGSFNSKYTSKFFKNYGVAIKDIKNNGKYTQIYRANGGESNTYFEYDKGVKKAKGKVGKFFEKIRSANEIIEMAPRIAEMISTLEDGKSLTEAMYNAAEITTNFKRGGDITKAINRNGANFLNASVQGLSKQYRNLTGQNGIKGYANLLVKATILGVAPAILNHLLLADDEDYQDLPDNDKDLYYLVKTGAGKFIRIPKGRVLSIFGSTARRILESNQGEEEPFKGLPKTIINQLGPNNPFTDNILAPITDAVRNKTWFGGDLVPLRLQDQLPKNQYDETTDAFSKFLGSKLNISPKKINYVLDQYSGGIGDILLPTMTPQAETNALAAKFTTDSVMKNRNVSKFFDTIDKQSKIVNDTIVSEEDELKLKYLNSMKSDMNKLYKEKREIQNSKISDKLKKQKVREIQSQINAIAEESLENYQDIDKQSNYSKIGDREYYLNSKNEWTKVSDDMKLDVKVKKLNIDKNTYFIKKEEYDYAFSNYDKYKMINYISTYDNYKKYKDEISNLKIRYRYGTTDKGKDEVIKYVNSLHLSIPKKAMLIKTEYSSYDKYNEEIVEYINSQRISKEEKSIILKELGFKVVNGKVRW